MASSKLAFLAALLLIASGLETFVKGREGPVGPPICRADNDCFKYCGPPRCIKCSCLYNQCFCSKADQAANVFSPISAPVANAFLPSP